MLDVAFFVVTVVLIAWFGVTCWKWWVRDAKEEKRRPAGAEATARASGALDHLPPKWEAFVENNGWVRERVYLSMDESGVVHKFLTPSGEVRRVVVDVNNTRVWF